MKKVPKNALIRKHSISLKNLKFKSRLAKEKIFLIPNILMMNPIGSLIESKEDSQFLKITKSFN